MKTKKLFYVISFLSLTTAFSFAMEKMTKIPRLDEIQSQAERLYPEGVWTPRTREILISAHVTYELEGLERKEESKSDVNAKAG